MSEEYSYRDIYLEKEGEEGYIGLHEIGMWDGPAIWMRMEAWANGYDKDKKFIASLWRMFGDIEETAREMEGQGWKRMESF